MAMGPRTTRERRIGVHDAPLGNGRQADAVEIAVAGQVGEEVVGKDAVAQPVVMAPQVVYVRRAEVGAAHPVEQPFEAGVHTIASLVLIVVGIAAIEMIELRFHLVQP